MNSTTPAAAAATRMTVANRVKAPQLERALAELLRETLERGFFGTARLEWALQDGTIQNIRRSVERIER
jgi:hypothetical protein